MLLMLVITRKHQRHSCRARDFDATERERLRQLDRLILRGAKKTLRQGIKAWKDVTDWQLQGHPMLLLHAPDNQHVRSDRATQHVPSSRGRGVQESARHDVDSTYQRIGYDASTATIGSARDESSTKGSLSAQVCACVCMCVRCVCLCIYMCM
jgi:hypothetical protein